MHSTLFFAEIPNPGPDWPKSFDFCGFLTNFLNSSNLFVTSLLYDFGSEITPEADN